MSLKRTKAVVASRRADAEKRLAEYNKLTLEQKLAKLPPEPHALRQRTKLLKQLEEAKAAPVASEKKKTSTKKSKKEVENESK